MKVASLARCLPIPSKNVIANSLEEQPVSGRSATTEVANTAALRKMASLLCVGGSIGTMAPAVVPACQQRARGR